MTGRRPVSEVIAELERIASDPNEPRARRDKAISAIRDMEGVHIASSVAALQGRQGSQRSTRGINAITERNYEGLAS